MRLTLILGVLLLSASPAAAGEGLFQGTRTFLKVNSQRAKTFFKVSSAVGKLRERVKRVDVAYRAERRGRALLTASLTAIGAAFTYGAGLALGDGYLAWGSAMAMIGVPSLAAAYFDSKGYSNRAAVKTAMDDDLLSYHIRADGALRDYAQKWTTRRRASHGQRVNQSERNAEALREEGTVLRQWEARLK